MARPLQLLFALSCIVIVQARYHQRQVTKEWCTTTTYCPDGYHCCPDLATCCPIGYACSGGYCVRSRNDVSETRTSAALPGALGMYLPVEPITSTTPEPVKFEVFFNRFE